MTSGRGGEGEPCSGQLTPLQVYLAQARVRSSFPATPSTLLPMMANPSTESRNKLVLITGSTGGIGRATALAFAKEGCYDLALHYNTAPESVREDLREAIDNATPKGSSCQHALFQADLSNFDDVRALHSNLVSRMGHPSILFNNAGSTCGISGPASFSDVPFEKFEESWRVNTGSSILLTQLCLPCMEEQGWGRVIFDSSVAAFTGGFVGPHYASSKSALHGFVHWLAGNVAKKVSLMTPIGIAMMLQVARADGCCAGCNRERSGARNDRRDEHDGQCRRRECEGSDQTA